MSCYNWLSCSLCMDTNWHKSEKHAVWVSRTTPGGPASQDQDRKWRLLYFCPTITYHVWHSVLFIIYAQREDDGRSRVVKVTTHQLFGYTKPFKSNSWAWLTSQSIVCRCPRTFCHHQRWYQLHLQSLFWRSSGSIMCHVFLRVADAHCKMFQISRSSTGIALFGFLKNMI